jgi:translation initiation factor 2B subunit (eIF-2B alpha/beta/delta family)
MPAVNFLEIPAANLGDGSQDTFELFARDFFDALGFEIEEGPSRGPDGGKDLVVLETLSGTLHPIKRRWVVSCKHYARSRKSVGDSDEIDIVGRVRKFKADGFIAFYSTIPSAELMRTLRSHEDEIAVEVFDRERIEDKLVSTSSLAGIFGRYFPDSYQKVNKKPNVLGSRLGRRLERIQNHVRELWKEHAGPHWYTFHDDSHSQRVEEMLYELIPRDVNSSLEEEEWFYLLASAWLHDVGMIVDLFGRPDPFEEVRAEHHRRSVRYIEENRRTLDLDHLETRIITEICKYHRKKENISACEPTVRDVRVQLLAAYLRLADALHTDKTRTKQAMYELLVASGMPWESRFHWLKSMWVESVKPDPDKMKIVMTVYDTPAGSPRQGLLPRLVEDEIREELDSVHKILVRGKISCFVDVEVLAFPVPEEEENLVELEQVLGNSELVNLSSASDVANCTIITVLRLSELGPDAYGTIRDYRKQLEEVFEARPCHTLVKKVLNIIEQATPEEHLPEESRATRVKGIEASLKALQDTRSSNITRLAENARPLLLDGSSILLFGYSGLVLKALEAVPPAVKKKTQVYVAECRGKSQYTYVNEVRYCDGLKYAVAVKERGFENVAIVPDICVGTLFAQDRIGKVLFGANGIDRSGRFGHTAGHLAIAELAVRYKVPVYVIADTSKFGDLREAPDLERTVQWLTRDHKVLEILAETGIRTINPREDIVGPDRVSWLITEEGVFLPTRIPKEIVARG